MLEPTTEYVIDDRTRERLENDFTYHAPFGDQVQRYADLREDFKRLAYYINAKCPPSRELSVALTHLEESCFYANAAIARNEKPEQ